MKKTIATSLLVAVAMLCGGMAWATTGNSFLAACVAADRAFDKKNIGTDDYIGVGHCIGYISGIVEVVGTINMASPRGDKKTFFCIPDGVTTQQLIRIVINTMKSNPENLHKESSHFPLVVAGLSVAYPCK